MVRRFTYLGGAENKMLTFNDATILLETFSLSLILKNILESPHIKMLVTSLVLGLNFREI